MWPASAGALGKIRNCQIAVTLQYQVGRSVLCIDADRYLPESWADDAGRRKKSGIPAETGCRPKWQMALEMIRRARSSGLNGPVLADSAYGSVTAFRRELDAMGMEWCLGIDSTLKVIDADEDLGEVGLQDAIGRPPPAPQADRAIRRVGERGRMGSRTAGFFSQSDLAAG